ncbi:MAG: GntR family transcriptional regulator [Lautropia sp.]
MNPYRSRTSQPSSTAASSRPLRPGRRTTQTLSLPEQIAEHIGNAINRGEYEPGSRIQEQEIAAQFDVSRGPVREALRILERDGLVEINARRGAQVTNLTIEELVAIFDPRIALNGLAARRAAERRDPEAIERIKAGVARLLELAREPDPDAYVDAMYGVHRAVADCACNPFLTRLVFLLNHQTLRYARLGLATTRRRQESSKNWKKMLLAIQAGDGDAAQAAAEVLARNSRDTVIRLLAASELSTSGTASVPTSASPAPDQPARPARIARKRS